MEKIYLKKYLNTFITKADAQAAMWICYLAPDIAERYNLTDKLGEDEIYWLLSVHSDFIMKHGKEALKNLTNPFRAALIIKKFPRFAEKYFREIYQILQSEPIAVKEALEFLHSEKILLH